MHTCGGPFPLLCFFQKGGRSFSPFVTQNRILVSSQELRRFLTLMSRGSLGSPWHQLGT